MTLQILFRPTRRRRRSRRGASTVEFALIAPFFILLIFSMFEFGRMLMVHQALTNATREGARQATLNGITEQDVKDVVSDYLASTVTVPDEDITVSPDPATSAFGDPITVSVSVSFNDVSWFPAPMFLADRQLQASTVMRRENIP